MPSTLEALILKRPKLQEWTGELSRWATSHPAFVAELNRRKRERADEHAERISEVTLHAVEVIAEALGRGDTSVALSCLRPPEPLSSGTARGRQGPSSGPAAGESVGLSTTWFRLVPGAARL